MISVSQVRAARALLELKQSDLADRAGVSLTAVNNLERGIGSPRLETLTAIQGALEDAGIQFLDGEGVKRRGEVLEIIRHEGAGVVKFLTDDMLTHLVDERDEVIMCGIDERQFVAREEEDVIRYAQATRDRTFRERILCRRGDKFFVSQPNRYRWISDQALGKIPYLVYQDRVIFMFWETPQRCLIIRNPSMADMFRAQFEFLWVQADIHGVTQSEWPTFDRAYKN